MIAGLTASLKVAFAEAIGIDRDVRLMVEELFFTLRTNLAFEIRNRHNPSSHPCPECFADPPDAAAPTTSRAACKG